MRTVGALAALAVVWAAPSHAGCWQAGEARAQAVQDLDTMLMVGALRCRAAAGGYLDRYNAFVIDARPTLQGVNATVRGHYRSAGDAQAVLTAYDRHITRVANRYGDDVHVACADLAALAERAEAAAGNADALVALAGAAGIEAQIDDARCEVAPAIAAAPVAVPVAVAMAAPLKKQPDLASAAPATAAPQYEGEATAALTVTGPVLPPR